ncbi:glycosyltransferase [Thermosynechococcus sp. QKsg1]|uniref:glycosyltransferase n=1 Tax=Thermosynechococcus sp. QKsg1 TaxID=3074130 RepID=UPI0028772B8D|nr:glycosyltransferase [Thermosynechococcus sp. QKsg1]WNC87896.1 glycosyltransferase [Thermosynechococcus sp. QKsg1]
MTHEPPKPTSPPQLVSPWVWGLFVFSILFLFGVLLATVWRPTLFPIDLVNPDQLRPLPDLLQMPTDDLSVWWPIVLAAVVAVALNFIPSNNVTRLIIRFIVILFGCRYLVWRGWVTLNDAHWLSFTASIGFYGLEVLYFFTYLLYFYQTAWLTTAWRSRQADHYQQAVLSGEYCPSVDIFIPTYNEPPYILRRTIVACQAINYRNKSIYVLDDGRRSEIADLCEHLGVNYLTRPTNEHRKAGNLNHALKYTTGELIAVFDADFIPFQNFLSRTVGFFQDDHVSMVQTPQHFFNPDYHSQNLGIEFMMPGDMEYFFGFIQPGRDFGNAIICCGTSYVVRRRDLEAVGGYYTRCVVEDFQTGTKMQIAGYRLVYLNEILSMGESPRNFQDHLEQRLRWLQGNMQIYFCGDDLPIWSKLSWFQRSCHLSLLLHNINPFIRTCFLVGPFLSLMTGISLTVATFGEYLFYALPYTLLTIATFSWATEGRYFSVWGEVYEVTFAFPGMVQLIKILRNPFGKIGSIVTNKGTLSNRKRLNLRYTWPLAAFVIAVGVGVFIRYGGYWLHIWPPMEYERAGLEVMLAWTLYNAFIALIAVLSSIDQPTRRQSDRFPVCTVCRFQLEDQTYWGYTRDVSETGAALLLTAGRFIEAQRDTVGTLTFLEQDFSVTAAVVRTRTEEERCCIYLRFLEVSDEAQRHLVQLLYGGLTWWHKPKAPNGLDAFWPMLIRLFDFRSLFSLYSNN